MLAKEPKSNIICYLLPRLSQDGKRKRKKEEKRPTDRQKNRVKLAQSSRVKKAWWLDGWLDTGREWKGELFTISEGNNKTMDLSINRGKQRQPYRITLYFPFSHSLLRLVSFFSFCILPEIWQLLTRRGCLLLYVRKYMRSWISKEWKKKKAEELHVVVKSTWINYILHKVSVLHYDFISLGKRIQQPNHKTSVVVDPFYSLKPHCWTCPSKLE